MAERRDAPLTIALAALTIVVVVAAAMLGRPKPPVPPALRNPPEISLLERNLTPAVDSAPPFDIAAYPPVARDPFGAPAPVARQEVAITPHVQSQPMTAESAQWIVSAILLTPTRPLAVINNVLVRPGDRLAGGARVLSMGRDSVVITDSGGARHVLHLRAGSG